MADGDGGAEKHGRRRWPRRLLIAAIALALFAAAGVTAAWAYGRSLNGKLHRIDALDQVPAAARPAKTIPGAMNILLLGSDSRDPDSTATSRTDTIMLLHVDEDHQHAYLISIPRDTWVHIPATADGSQGNVMAKINAGYALGGATLAVQTVEAFTGVRIDHVVVIDFAGFARVVDALGGVDLTIDKTITSIHTGRVYEAGPQHLNGNQALDWVRQRKQFPDGDFARERHQQEFLKALLDKATSTGTLTKPAKLNAFLQSVATSITVDTSFDLLDTAFTLKDLRSNDITFLTSPSAGTGIEDGQSVVWADTEKASALYQAVASDKIAQYLATAP